MWTEKQRHGSSAFASSETTAATRDPIRYSSTARAHCRPWRIADHKRPTAPHIASREYRLRGPITRAPRLWLLRCARIVFNPAGHSPACTGLKKPSQQHQVCRHLELEPATSRILIWPLAGSFPFDAAGHQVSPCRSHLDILVLTAQSRFAPSSCEDEVRLGGPIGPHRVVLDVGGCGNNSIGDRLRAMAVGRTNVV
jgi:hypothetical protein